MSRDKDVTIYSNNKRLEIPCHLGNPTAKGQTSVHLYHYCHEGLTCVSELHVNFIHPIFNYI